MMEIVILVFRIRKIIMINVVIIIIYIIVLTILIIRNSSSAVRNLSFVFGLMITCLV